MKLYYSPGACSLADHIALNEAGLQFERESVDLKTKQTEHGADFNAINPKGYVPALTLDSGETLTENVALLDWIADQSQTLRPEGPLGRTRQLELLGYITTEVHKSFGPLFKGGSDEEKSKAKQMVASKFAFIAEQLDGDYLVGARPHVPDFYLFVMLMWAGKFGIDLPPTLAAYRERLMKLESVQKALQAEGLS